MKADVDTKGRPLQIAPWPPWRLSFALFLLLNAGVVLYKTFSDWGEKGFLPYFIGWLIGFPMLVGGLQLFKAWWRE